MSESRAKRVRIKEVDGWTLKLLVDYVYTAEIKVTEENVQVRSLIVTCERSYSGSYLVEVLGYNKKSVSLDIRSEPSGFRHLFSEQTVNGLSVKFVILDKTINRNDKSQIHLSDLDFF